MSHSEKVITKGPHLWSSDGDESRASSKQASNPLLHETPLRVTPTPAAGGGSSGPAAANGRRDVEATAHVRGERESCGSSAGAAAARQAGWLPLCGHVSHLSQLKMENADAAVAAAPVGLYLFVRIRGPYPRKRTDGLT